MTMRMLALAALTSAGLVAVPLTAAANALPSASATTFGAASPDAMSERMKAVYGESHAYRTFFERLQAAVSKDQKMTVARMVAYPFRTMVNGESVTLRNRWQFHEVYDQVISAGVRAAIEAQDFKDLIVAPSGVGVGSGDLWFADVNDGRKADIRIIAINQRGEAGV